MKLVFVIEVDLRAFENGDGLRGATTNGQASRKLRLQDRWKTPSRAADSERHDFHAVGQKPVAGGKFVTAEARRFRFRSAIGSLWSNSIVGVDHCWISRSRRQLAGLWSKACLNSLHKWA